VLGLSCAARIAAAAGRAHACATCGCGDPTLTAVGVEKPYKNRLRVALEERVGSHTMGAAEELSSTLMTRTALSVAYTPHERLTLTAYLPFVASHLENARQDAWVRGLGELELTARAVVARDRRFAPRHLLWLIGGVKAPTAPRVYDDAGFPYPDDDQPGTGSWDPIAGATYAWFGRVTIYTSALFRYPTENPRGRRFGWSLLSSTVAQLQPFSWLALQLGADLRYQGPDLLPNGAAASNTGGFIAQLTPGVMVNPWRDLLLRVAVEVPVVQVLRGTQSTSPQLVFSVAYDFL
jgi:hypothetical protein